MISLSYPRTLINLVHENDHVFNTRPGGILACVMV
jgi:hypothetical protein